MLTLQRHADAGKSATSAEEGAPRQRKPYGTVPVIESLLLTTPSAREESEFHINLPHPAPLTNVATVLLTDEGAGRHTYSTYPTYSTYSTYPTYPTYSTYSTYSTLPCFAAFSSCSCLCGPARCHWP